MKNDDLSESFSGARAITGASMARGRSKQDYGTPRDLLDAVERRFGALAWDLAAEAHNAKASNFIGADRDSITVAWDDLAGNLWLNPPFGNIAPWAEKCCKTCLSPTSRILLLVPASIGANWFAEWVHRSAFVLGLQGRLTFEGCDQPYPKDCLLAVYGADLAGFDVWDWRGGGRS